MSLDFIADTAGIAAALHVDRSTVSYWRRRDDFPAPLDLPNVLAERAPLYSLPAVKAWHHRFAAQRRPLTAAAHDALVQLRRDGEVYVTPYRGMPGHGPRTYQKRVLQQLVDRGQAVVIPFTFSDAEGGMKGVRLP